MGGAGGDGSAGGGMVTVRIDGHKNVLGVKIDPEVAGDVEMLQDLVMAACNEAVKKVDAETQQKIGLATTPVAVARYRTTSTEPTTTARAIRKR